MTNRTVYLLCLLSLPSLAAAGELSYDCFILKVYHLDDAGTLEVSSWQEYLKDGKFSVSRETGRVVGSSLTTMFAKKVRVINSGSEANSFKAVSEFAGQIQVIEVQEFRDDIEKPFVAMSMGGAGIVSGTCK
jgi:hypothetical protein